MGIWRQTVVTNGSLPTEKYIRATKTLHQITFSYHFEHTVHDKIVNNILAVNNAYKNENLHVILTIYFDNHCLI